MAILNLPPLNQIQHQLEWNGKTGQQVEDYISRCIKESLDSEIESMTYEGKNLILRKRGENKKPLTAEITVIEPDYAFGIFMYGIEVNGKRTVFNTSDSLTKLTLDIQYKKDQDIKLGLLMYSTVITDKEVDRLQAYDVNITYSGLVSKSEKISLKSSPKASCKLDPDSGVIIGALDELAVKWVSIKELFRETNKGKLTATILDKRSKNEYHSPQIEINTEAVSLSYDIKQIVVSDTTIGFTLNGTLDPSLYNLIVYNNGIKENRKENLIYSNLHPGLNLLVVQAYKVNTDIVSDYIYVDIICTKNFKDTAVAINGISKGIKNNGVSKLYTIHVFSFDRKRVELITYLEDTIVSNRNPEMHNKLKHEIIDADAYDELNTATIEYNKYIEIDSEDSVKYLVVDIPKNGILNLYKHYIMERGELTANVYREMKIDAVNRNFLYYNTFAPKYNFDLNLGQLNNVFVTKDYANNPELVTINSNIEASDGWDTGDNGRLYFRASAQTNPILKKPLKLELGSLFTIELGFKTYNISDDTKPIISFGNFLLRPTLLCWSTDNENVFKARNSLFESDEEIHLLITGLKNYTISKSDVYYPKFLGSFLQDFDSKVESLHMNLIRIYINGVIDREINLSDSEYASLLVTTNPDFIINPINSDINFYTLRVYNNVALNFNQVQQNYISFLRTRDEKLKFFDDNSILKTVGKNIGEISFKDSRTKFNTLVYVFPKGGKFPNRAWGGADKDPISGIGANNDIDKKICTTLFVNYADPATNDKYGGRLTNGLVKGQGSSAMKYLIWNVTFGMNKVKRTVKGPDGENVIDPETGEPKEVKLKSRFTAYSNMDKITNTFNPVVEKELPTYYLMPPYKELVDKTPYKITKLVGKVNFASSMLSHKLGACKLYEDMYKATSHKTPISGRKAVHEEPFLYFYWESDLDEDAVRNLNLADLLKANDDIHFMGFQTWGSGKGDDETSGYDEDTTPEYLLMEGGENTDVSVNFRAPWQALQRGNSKLDSSDSYKLENYPTVSYEDSLRDASLKLYIRDESIIYAARGAWDVDYGLKDFETKEGFEYFRFTEGAKKSLNKFRAFYDYIYTHDINLIFIYKEPTELDWLDWVKSEEDEKNKTEGMTKRKFVIMHQRCPKFAGHKAGDMYRYDDINKEWVRAGVSYNLVRHEWDRANIGVIAGYGDGEIRDEETLINAIKKQVLGAVESPQGKMSDFVDVSDIAYHLAVIKLLSGTDNRAKNTYYLVFGQKYKLNPETEKFDLPDGEADYKIRMMLDDLDTVLVTDNNGLQSKPYNLLEGSYKREHLKYWGDANSAFFYLFDQVFESDDSGKYPDNIRQELNNILANAFAESPDINNKENYFYKVFFSIQDKLPAVAYNHTAKIYYENAQLILNSGAIGVYRNNNVTPIEQSHGSNLSCEKEFMKKRFTFLASYARSSVGGSLLKTSTSAASGESPKLRIEFTPYLDLYPVRDYEGIRYMISKPEKPTYAILDYLAEANKPYTVTCADAIPAINQALLLTNLYKKLDILGLHTGILDADFDKTTKFVIDNKGLKKYPEFFGPNYPKENIGSFTAKFPVLEELILHDMKVLEILDLSKLLKLKTIDVTDTTGLLKVIFPKSGRLTSVKLPKTIQDFELFNNPMLKNITFEGYDNLQSVFIDCAKCSNFDVVNFCNLLVSCPKLNKVTLRDCNISLTEETLTRLLEKASCNLTGVIKIVDSLGTKSSINFNLKSKLVKLFGNIESRDNKLFIDFVDVPIYLPNIQYNKEVSIYRLTEPEGTVITKYDPFSLNITSGNDILITSYQTDTDETKYRLNIDYSLNCPSEVATINQEGTIYLHKEVPYLVVASIVLHTKTAGNLTIKSNLNFTWKAPNIGDLAYADGTFSNTYDSSKDLIGLVFAKEISTTESGDLYILGTLFAQKDYEYIGYDDSIRSDETSDERLNLLAKVAAFLNKYSISNYLSVPTAELNPQNKIIYNKAKDGSVYNDTSIIHFTGKEDTLAYINKVNNSLLGKLRDLLSSADKNLISVTPEGAYYINSLENLNILKDKIVDINRHQLPSSRMMECLLYPYFYSTYLYEPKTNGTLDPQYTKNNWYVPSIGEWSRILYYRGYSALGKDFTFESNINDGIREDIPINYKNILEIPIFSMAHKTMGTDPYGTTNWNAVEDSLESSNTLVYQITASSYNGGSKYNYAYRRYSASISGGIYENHYEWHYGQYSSDGYVYNDLMALNSAWRLNKGKCLPIVKYHYTKIK